MNFTVNVKDTNDYLVTNNVCVAVPMTPSLSLKVPDGVSYLNQPAAGYKGTDTSTTAAKF